MSNYNELKLTYQGGRQETITLTASIIDYGAYQDRNIIAVEVPEIVEIIDGYAFCDNNELANIVLNEGLQRIEGQAFQHGVYTAVTIPSTVTYIGFNSFNISGEQEQDQHTFTITCLASTPPELDDPEGITFGNPDFLSAIYVPDGSVSAYQEAWRDYASKIQGGAAPADNMLTNLNIKAAYVGTDEVVKMYLGYDVVWEPAPEPDPCEGYEEGTKEKCECEGRYWWDGSCHDEPEPEPIDPCEGLTGESLCNCQGKYWWGNDCHDEPDTMPTTPLTFEITGVGTGSTGSIGLRLSGDTRWSNRRRVTYYLTHEGTETSGNLMLNEAVSNSAITSLISGLTVGDKIEFWGDGDQRGMSVSTSAFEYFVTSAGLTAKVYGNVNSLLFAGDFYHGQPVPQTGETDAYAFFRLFRSKTGFTFGAPDDLQHIVLPVPANGLQDSIYREMFYGCTSMTTAPELPATTLAANCYRSMFNGCTSLTAATTLPALSVPDYAYLSMFADCPITQAPVLPATTLSQYCYSQMFRGTNITDMPDLPATTLAQYCYQGMFSACTSLTTAPELPATTLKRSCYESMFSNCTSLTSAPELPATTLAMYCYGNMFYGCTSLTTAPALPATTLTEGCYQSMFYGCNLTQAPELPATTLANSCYKEMFKGCTRLTQAPALPATTLAVYCYDGMFQNCTSLTTAPELLATTLISYCYAHMFRYCSSLNYVKCLATNSGNDTINWVDGVASSGTFVKRPNATWTIGVNGAPKGWTIVDA